MPAPNEIWWRAFHEAVQGLVNEGVYDRREIDRVAIQEADRVLDYVASSECECAAGDDLEMNDGSGN